MQDRRTALDNVFFDYAMVGGQLFSSSFQANEADSNVLGQSHPLFLKNPCNYAGLCQQQKPIGFERTPVNWQSPSNGNRSNLIRWG